MAEQTTACEQHQDAVFVPDCRACREAIRAAIREDRS